MKFFFTLMTVFFSSLVLADSASFHVAPFQGEVKLSQSDLKVVAVNVTVRLQHCNFWGTTCAGGPSESITEAVSFKNDSATNLISFSSSKKMSLKSSFFGNQFSSCNLALNFYLIDKTGKKFEGYLKLIHENNKEKCSDKAYITETIQEVLKVPRVINVWAY